MNKRAFTLVELLATIVIIALIMSIVMPSAARLSERNKDKLYKEYEKMMIEYAKVSELNDGDTIDLFELEELDKIQNECLGYVSIDHATIPPTYTAHISCGDQYESPTYDETKSNPICPGCKFMYINPSEMYTVWKDTNIDYSQSEPSIVTTGLYDNVSELVSATGTKHFLGLRLNSKNQVTNAYACGIKNNVTFCVEGTKDGSKYTSNKKILENTGVWDNLCSESSWNDMGELVYDYECHTDEDSLTVNISSNGVVGVSEVKDAAYFCRVGSEGMFGCNLD